MERYFCAVYEYAEKHLLSKGCWNLNRRLGINLHFSEIIKLTFGKKMQNVCGFLCVCILKLFCICLLYEKIIVVTHNLLFGSQ